ncbi:hypothetical protein HDU93_010079 [Gonapodya sp. JEL0774]|nr:hypothetical protein HDU93_010079 [Gonapodya sp. JEL0774]
MDVDGVWRAAGGVASEDGRETKKRKPKSRSYSALTETDAEGQMTIAKRNSHDGPQDAESVNSGERQEALQCPSSVTVLVDLPSINLGPINTGSFDTTHWDAMPMPDLPAFDAGSWQMTRSLTAFDDLPPVPAPQLINSLVHLYFDRFPLHFSIVHFSLVHRASFLQSPTPPNPIVYYAILTIGSHMHESPEVRAMGRAVFFPRLRRAIKASADRPGLAGLVGLLYGFTYAVKHVMWKEAYFYYIQCASHIKLLNFTTERSLIDRLDSWADRESFRRSFWFTYILDRSMAAATNRPPVWNSPHLPPATYVPPYTLDTFFSIRPTSHLPEPQPTALSQFAFEAALSYPFGHVVDFHQHYWNRGVLPFAPLTDRQRMSVLARVAEIEEELETWKRKLEEYVAKGSVGLSETSLATEFVLRPVWIASSPNPGADYHVGNFDRDELEKTLVAWSQSPAFLTAFAHAAEASEIAKVSESIMLEERTDQSHDATTFL